MNGDWLTTDFPQGIGFNANHRISNLRNNYEMVKLYQFQFSHYCEKARWALDFKGIRYEHQNLLPGLHVRVARKLAPKSCLPILVDGGSIVQDSSAIISFLDQRYPDHPLTPQNPVETKQALEWEKYF